MVDTPPTSPRIQIEIRSGFSTSSTEYGVDDLIIDSTTSHLENGPSLLPPSALSILPTVLSGPIEPMDIRHPQDMEPETTKGPQLASRWRRKVRSAMSQK